MAPVQSRLVLAVSVPAAALAIFLSLFWLRRASKGHPPSPPDIPDKSESVLPTDDIPASSDQKSEIQRRRSIPPSESSIESPVLGQFITNVCAPPLTQEPLKASVDNSVSPFEPDIRVPEEAISIVDDKEDRTDPTEGAGDSVSEIHCETEDIGCDDPQSSGIEMMTEETSAPLEMAKSDLSEKLANLELDTMKMSEVDPKERDSANHSPSEIMLASPSMSNFSDAHSEGSSDSGKGHSDGTTSPSRTPAGGSSVSGDPSPSIYEFIIPQVIVGRLIGRHGVFLHEIMSATHTSIFIKVHPETDKLKICAIEGSQQDIDKALEMIRKKFPLRRYPKLTLERVSFVQIQQAQQLRSEDFHLQLIEGVNNDVILSSLLNAGQFFVQQPCHPSYPCLTPLTQTLTHAYSTTDPPALVNPVPDAICVCPSLGGWYRAQIMGVDDDSRHCDIKFVDYGGYLRVDSSLLKQIRADFLMLPFQAVECSLANVQPIHEMGWSEEARLFVHNMTFGRVLQAQVVSYTEAGIPLVNLYTSINAQVVLVNAELVSNGYAIYTPSVQTAQTQDKDECQVTT